MRWMAWAALLAGGAVGWEAWSDANVANSDRPRPALRAFAAEAAPSPLGRRPSLPVRTPVATAVATATGEPFGFEPPNSLQYLQAGGAYHSYEVVAVGDVTGDGRDDIVALPGGNEIHLLLQAPDGQLREPQVWRYADEAYLHPKELVLADFNEDGVLDVAATSLQGQFQSQGGLNLLLSDGRGGLALRQVPGELGTAARDWVVLDADRDGHQDIVGFENVSDYSFGEECGAQRFTCPRYRVMHGDGSGGFGRVATVQLRQPHTVRGIGTRDVDGDGHLDLVMALMGDPFSAGRVVAQRHDGRGALLPMQELYAAPEALGGVAVGDFDGDGRADLVVKPTYQFDPIWVVPQTAAGTFVPAYMLPTYAPRAGWPRVADFDGDGREDLALVQMRPVPGTGVFEVHAGVNLQRDGRLQAPVLSAAYLPLDKVSTHRDGLATGDINGDGCRDLVVAASYEGLVLVRGKGCLSLAPPPMSDPLPPERVGD